MSPVMRVESKFGMLRAHDHETNRTRNRNASYAALSTICDVDRIYSAYL